MSSVGAIKIPLVSTLDPKGFNDLKAKMQELDRTPGGGGAGGGGAGGDGGGGESQISNFARQAGSRISQVASGISGGSEIGNLIAKSALGPAAAGMAVFAFSQKMAGQAMQVRKAASDIGVSAGYYYGLERAARAAGLGLEEVTGAVTSVSEKATSAALGGSMGGAAFLHSLGLTDRQIAAGMGNSEKLVSHLRGLNLSAGEKGALFGSAKAGDAVLGATAGGWDQSGVLTDRASRLKIGLQGLGETMLGIVSLIPAAISDPAHFRDYVASEQDRVSKQREDEINSKDYAKRQTAGEGLYASLASPRAIEAYTNTAPTTSSTPRTRRNKTAWWDSQKFKPRRSACRPSHPTYRCANYSIGRSTRLSPSGEEADFPATNRPSETSSVSKASRPPPSAPFAPEPRTSAPAWESRRESTA